MEIAASELIERIKEFIQQGNIRRFIIRNQKDEVLVEVPLTARVAVGGVVTLITPVLAALGRWQLCLPTSKSRLCARKITNAAVRLPRLLMQADPSSTLL